MCLGANTQLLVWRTVHFQSEESSLYGTQGNLRPGEVGSAPPTRGRQLIREQTVRERIRKAVSKLPPQPQSRGCATTREAVAGGARLRPQLNSPPQRAPCSSCVKTSKQETTEQYHGVNAQTKLDPVSDTPSHAHPQETVYFTSTPNSNQLIESRSTLKSQEPISRARQSVRAVSAKGRGTLYFQAQHPLLGRTRETCVCASVLGEGRPWQVT